MKKVMFYSLTGTVICVASYLSPGEAITTKKELSEFYTKERGKLAIEPVSRHERINYIP